MEEVLIWRLIAGAALAIVSYMAQQWFRRLNAKIDELITAIKEVALLNERQSGEIKLLKNTQELHEKRLNAHAQQIRELQDERRTIRKS